MQAILDAGALQVMVAALHSNVSEAAKALDDPLLGFDLPWRVLRHIRGASTAIVDFAPVAGDSGRAVALAAATAGGVSVVADLKAEADVSAKAAASSYNEREEAPGTGAQVVALVRADMTTIPARPSSGSLVSELSWMSCVLVVLLRHPRVRMPPTQTFNQVDGPLSRLLALAVAESRAWGNGVAQAALGVSPLLSESESRAALFMLDLAVRVAEVLRVPIAPCLADSLADGGDDHAAQLTVASDSGLLSQGGPDTGIDIDASACMRGSDPHEVDSSMSAFSIELDLDRSSGPGTCGPDGDASRIAVRRGVGRQKNPMVSLRRLHHRSVPAAACSRRRDRTAGDEDMTRTISIGGVTSFSLKDVDTCCIFLTLVPLLQQLRMKALARSNAVGDALVKGVAGTLRMLAHLTDLDLSNNLCTDQGAMALAAAIADLPHESKIQCLCLSGNEINDAGLVPLSRALPHLRQLRELELRGLCLTDGAAREFGVALRLMDQHYLSCGTCSAQHPTRLRIDMRYNCKLTIIGQQSLASGDGAKPLDSIYIQFDDRGALLDPRGASVATVESPALVDFGLALAPSSPPVTFCLSPPQDLVRLGTTNQAAAAGASDLRPGLFDDAIDASTGTARLPPDASALRRPSAAAADTLFPVSRASPGASTCGLSASRMDPANVAPDSASASCAVPREVGFDAAIVSSPSDAPTATSRTLLLLAPVAHAATTSTPASALVHASPESAHGPQMPSTLCSANLNSFCDIATARPSSTVEPKVKPEVDMPPSAAASAPLHSRWAVATQDAADRFRGGVMRRVPMATVISFRAAHLTCNVAFADLPWVETVLADVEAERLGLELEPVAMAAALPVASAATSRRVATEISTSQTTPEPASALDLVSRGGTCSVLIECSRGSAAQHHPQVADSRKLFFIDIVADGDPTRPSWISSLRLRRQHAARVGADKVALLLELLVGAFPEVSAGQVWVPCRDGHDDAQRHLLSFVSFPAVPCARALALADRPHAARAFAAMLHRELDVDPLTVIEVDVSHDLLAFPKLGGRLFSFHKPMPAAAEPKLAWNGFLDTASIGVLGDPVVRVSAIGGVRNDTRDKDHGSHRTVGAVVSSLAGDCAVAYAVTAGHFLEGVEEWALCEKEGGDELAVQYVGHCDVTTLIPREAALFTTTSTDDAAFAAVVDVGVFSFQRNCCVMQVPTVQPLAAVNAPVLFPSPECWAHAGVAIMVRGSGRSINIERGCGLPPLISAAGERTYDVCGWMTASMTLPTQRKVTQCLYLAKQTSALGFVPGHSGGSLYADVLVPPQPPQLHSFVSRNVILTEVDTGRVWHLLGSTPAVLALEQARALIRTHEKRAAGPGALTASGNAWGPGAAVALAFPDDSNLAYVQPAPAAPWRCTVS